MPEIIDIQDVRNERSVRKYAEQLGYRISKSRARISLDNHGEYMLFDHSTDGVVGGSRYDWTLADIWSWLVEEEDAQASA